MILTLTRTRTGAGGVFGQLKGEGLFLYTLEHSYGGKPKLYDGTFVCKRGQHMLHSGPIETFEITGVEGHSGILFHPGNTEADSEGCVLLGRNSDDKQVYDSKKAFQMFMDTVKDLEEFTLIVTS